MQNKALEKWEEKQLKEICDFHNGLWTGKKEPFIECNVIRNANFTKDFKLNYDNVVKINVEERQFQTRELEYGDLILEKSGGGPNQPVGRVVIFDKHEKGYSFSNFTSSIRIKNKNILDFRFLYLYLCHCYLSGMTTKMQKNSTGIRNLLFDDYKNISVPIPNISEQQRIVGILDEAFENIDKAKQNALQNLNNAKELFKSTISDIYSNLNTKPIKLSSLADVYSGYAFKSVDFNDKGFYQVLRLGNVKQGFLRLLANPVYISNISEDVLSKSLLKKGNAVITQTGTKNKRDYGFVAIVDSDNLLLNQRLAKVKFKELLIPEYFYYYSYTNTYKDEFFANEGGTVGQGNVGLNDIKNLTIPYVEISEQQKIVTQLDELQEQTKKLEQIYEQRIKDLDELKQSILQKAFNGEL